MTELGIADCINEFCPWSGKPVRADSLTDYDGRVVGFCNTGCRERFDTAIRHFEGAQGGESGAVGSCQEILRILDIVSGFAWHRGGEPVNDGIQILVSVEWAPGVGQVA